MRCRTGSGVSCARSRFAPLETGERALAIVGMVERMRAPTRGIGAGGPAISFLAASAARATGSVSARLLDSRCGEGRTCTLPGSQKGAFRTRRRLYRGSNVNDLSLQLIHAGVDVSLQPVELFPQHIQSVQLDLQ